MITCLGLSGCHGAPTSPGETIAQSLGVAPGGSALFEAVFHRSTGAPTVQRRTIEGIEGDFFIDVLNGANGSARASSASIRVDGAPVFGPSDFNQGVAHITRVVTLQDPSVLEVQLRSEPGAAIQVSVRAAARVGDEGGVIVAGPVRLDVPPGALPSDETITIEPADPTAPGFPPLDVLFAGDPVDFGPSGLTFDVPVRVSMSYDDQLLPPGVPESGLGVYFGSLAGWEELEDIRVDEVANVVSGSTTHFTPMAPLPSIVNVCPGVAPENVGDGLATVAPGGTIVLCQGDHVADEVVVAKPVEVVGDPGGSRIVNALPDGASAFDLGPVYLGRIRFVDLEFATTSATGVRAVGDLDDVELRSVHFNLPIDRRGPIGAALGSTFAIDSIVVDGSTFSGGSRGLTLHGNVDIRASSFVDVFTASTMADGTSLVVREGSHFERTRISGGVFGGTHSILLENSAFVDCRGNCMGFGGGVFVVRGNSFTSTGADRPATGLVTFFDVPNTDVTIEDNTFQWLGPAGFGIAANIVQRNDGHGTLTVARNTVDGAFAFIAGSGPGIVLSGSDNLVSNVEAVFRGLVGLTGTMKGNDFVGYATAINTSQSIPIDLTCNWWGSAAGPSGVVGPVAPAVFTPWAAGPVANGGGGACDGS